MVNATKKIYLSGIAMYPQVYEANMDKTYNKYSITLKLDEPSKIAFRASGANLKARSMPGDDGVWYKFSRDHEKDFGKGEVEVLGPPAVLTKKEGTEDAYENFKEPIGNGSEVTILVSVYPTKKGPGTRLEKVCVDKLVPYVPREKEAVDPNNPVF